MRKVLVIMAVATLVCSIGGAEVKALDTSVHGQINIEHTRTNGTLGAFSASITQVGALEVVFDATVTTAGGDGAPLTVTTGGGSVLYLNDQIWLLAQIYDSPWSAHTFSYTGTEYHINSPVALGSFTSSFSTTVPREANYQLWVAALAGVTWPTESYAWGSISQGLTSGGQYLSFYTGPVATTYVDATQPPTPTPDPDAGGNPIPTLNWLGMLAMIAMLSGVAVLVFIRRR